MPSASRTPLLHGHGARPSWSIRGRCALVCWVLAWGAVWFGPQPVFGQVIRFQPQQASAAGQGNAFSAQADDPSALHYNPAGMTQLHGIQMSVGGSLMGGSVKYKSPAGADVRGDFGGSVLWPAPTQFYVTANLGDLGLSAVERLTAGFGITTPFGQKIRYPDDSPLRFAAVSATLPLMDLKPTLAYRLTDQISIGVGADVYTFASFIDEGQTEQRLASPGGGGLPPPGTSLEFNGKDTAAGFNVSLFYTPFRNEDGKPLVNIGLVYRSQATLHLTGSFLAGGALVSGASTTLVLPQIFTAAVAIWPVRDREREWKLELDVDYAGWKSVRNLDLRLDDGRTIPQPQNWRTTPVMMVGTEYRLLHPAMLPAWEVAFRAGYTYTQNPVPDQTFTPFLPAFDSHTLAFGLGFLCKEGGWLFGVVPCGGSGRAFLPKAIGFDVAYQEWFYEGRTVTGNNNPAVDGSYDMHIHLGAMNVKFLF